MADWEEGSMRWGLRSYNGEHWIDLQLLSGMLHVHPAMWLLL